MDRIIEILEGIHPNVDYSTETELVDDGVLNSFDIMALVTALNDEYGIEIGMDELLPENFNSAEAIYELVKDLQEE